MEISIKRRALLSAIAGAKAAYPNEFLCLLTGKREGGRLLVEDTIIPPGIMVSETMSSFSEWMLPTIDGLVGTFHSHPGASSRPSRQDLLLFSQKGGVNFICGAPFGEKSARAYDSQGRQLRFSII